MPAEFYIAIILALLVVSGIASRLLYIDYLDRQAVAKAARETELKDIYEAQIVKLEAANEILLDRLFHKENLPPSKTNMVAERDAVKQQRRSKTENYAPKNLGMLHQARLDAFTDAENHTKSSDVVN